ncbi:MAG: rod shape-determining protein MreC [Actinomycetota bacterium]
MAIYTVGRRRVILVLLLTSALLLTLDLRGNAVLDRGRDAFSFVMGPVEDAAEVVTGPVERLWSAYNDYPDVKEENEILRARLAEIEGTQAAAQASVIDFNALLSLQDLPSLEDIPTEVAEVVGRSSNNLDQLVEINKGSLDGIRVGMAVVNEAGLIGRITATNLSSSQVMLVTDSRYSVAVEVLAGIGDIEDVTTDTTPSGLTPDEADDLSSPPDDVPEATSPLDVLAEGDFPLPDSDDGLEDDTGEAADDASGDESDLPPSTTTTTTTLPPAIPADGSPVQTAASADGDDDAPADEDEADLPEVAKEFGLLEGAGRGRLPKVAFVQDNPALTTLQIGDLVQTAGIDTSLAPAGIPVGRVINRADRPGVAGPLIEVELLADLDQLVFVRVVQFQPPPELGQ